jgi:hypothetical protein
MKSIFEVPRQISGLGSSARRTMKDYVLFHIIHQARRVDWTETADHGPSTDLAPILGSW